MKRGSSSSSSSFSGLSCLLLLVCCSFRWTSSFHVPSALSRSHRHHCLFSRESIDAPDDSSEQLKSSENEDDDQYDEVVDQSPSQMPIPGLEKAWRYAKKPLMSIGSKGATAAHGNSLRQLLDSHTAVKVKVVSTQSYDDKSLQSVFLHLRDLAVESGASIDMELLQARQSERILLIGMPGTLDRIQSGDFPPEPVVWSKDPKERKIVM